jgi:hypothetical protein
MITFKPVAAGVSFFSAFGFAAAFFAGAFFTGLLSAFAEVTSVL